MTFHLQTLTALVGGQTGKISDIELVPIVKCEVFSLYDT